MSIIACLTTEHNPWLVLLAALTCISGSWVGFGLFRRACERNGGQQAGWLFLAAIAAGSSVWCTHFIAMLAYQPKAPFAFDPGLTMLSLLVVIAGAAIGFAVALINDRRIMPWIGGGIVGMAIAGMHYTGMAAYHVDGIVVWNWTDVALSVIFSVVLAGFAVPHAVRSTSKVSLWGLGFFVLAVVSLHFTGMSALSITPFTNAPATPQELEGLAVAVSGVSLIIAATGIASALIDSRSAIETFQRMEHLAHSDALTGLPNRLSLGVHLASTLDHAKATGGRLGLLGIDLDRFKEINDLRGHQAGDLALVAIAGRLSALLREGEFVARVGGDEFVAVKSFDDEGDLRDFVQRVDIALNHARDSDDFAGNVGGSIGVASYPQDGDTAERLISNADLAMYRAKADLTRSVCFYEATMDEMSRSRSALAADLRRAIANDELQLHYQVQTEVKTGAVRGYEVLLRWTHPVRGSVPPAEFIPIAEETGLILEIGEWVLRKACLAAASWSEPHRIAVNLSPIQFAHADLARMIHQVLLETGLSPARLELEITESTIIADKMRALHTLRQIRILGVTIALDDFGIGYSSLETLRSFPFDKIKLDRSFMSEVERSPQAKAIVRAVLTLGKTLEIAVLAEGVETLDQLNVLRAEGCDEAQGYFLGRPAPLGAQFVSTPIEAEPARLAG